MRIARRHLTIVNPRHPERPAQALTCAGLPPAADLAGMGRRFPSSSNRLAGDWFRLCGKRNRNRRRGRPDRFCCGSLPFRHGERAGYQKAGTDHGEPADQHDMTPEAGTFGGCLHRPDQTQQSGASQLGVVWIRNRRRDFPPPLARPQLGHQLDERQATEREGDQPRQCEKGRQRHQLPSNSRPIRKRRISFVPAPMS